MNEAISFRRYNGPLSLIACTVAQHEAGASKLGSDVSLNIRYPWKQG
jgi:hypothetical protein